MTGFYEGYLKLSEPIRLFSSHSSINLLGHSELLIYRLEFLIISFFI